MLLELFRACLFGGRRRGCAPRTPCPLPHQGGCTASGEAVRFLGRTKPPLCGWSRVYKVHSPLGVNCHPIRHEVSIHWTEHLILCLRVPGQSCPSGLGWALWRVETGEARGCSLDVPDNGIKQNLMAGVAQELTQVCSMKVQNTYKKVRHRHPPHFPLC